MQGVVQHCYQSINQSINLFGFAAQRLLDVTHRHNFGLVHVYVQSKIFTSFTHCCQLNLQLAFLFCQQVFIICKLQVFNDRSLQNSTSTIFMPSVIFSKIFSDGA
jgi:hypothetical protein